MADYGTIKIERATAENYEEIVSEANVIFTSFKDENGNPTVNMQYFQNLLPKLYKDETCSMPAHYFIREEGKVVALAGAFENTFSVGDKTLKMRGIGTVGVDAFHRSKGYMKALLAQILEDCVKDGIDFSFLGGARQRYEHFGFTTAGMHASFEFHIWNMNYLFGKNADFGFTFQKLTADMTAELDAITELQGKRKVHADRPREKMFDILCSWRKAPVVMYKNGEFFGWCVTSDNFQYIEDLTLLDDSEIGHVLNDYMRKLEAYHVKIGEVGLFDRTKLSFLARCSESQSISPIKQFRIWNYATTLDAFLTLKASYAPLCDGEVTFEIAGKQTVRVSVKNGVVSVTETDGTPDVVLSELDAAQFFFGPESHLADFSADMPAVALQWFPLPLAFSSSDSV